MKENLEKFKFERLDADDKFYAFWVGSIRYSGRIIDETKTHWIVEDIKEGRIELPKGNTVKKPMNNEAENAN